MKRKQIIDQNEIIKRARDLNGVTIIKRHSQATHAELDKLEKQENVNKEKIVLLKNERFHCYGCGEKRRTTHPVYILSCVRCGDLYSKNRHLSRDLAGAVALVTGARTKLGHQIALKLMRANARVICTSRFPEKMKDIFSCYEDNTCFIYPYSLDFDIPNLKFELERLRNWIQEKFGMLDILVNSAAQTIRCREKKTFNKDENKDEKNRYDDPKHVSSSNKNSWLMRMGDFEQEEMEELYRVNAIAPCLLIQELVPLMRKSKIRPYIINVHAREGLFQVRKDDLHLHTNMAKAGICMLTKCLVKSKLYTEEGKKFSIHGCDPGWFSIDEYYEGDSPFSVPPLDEVDGAARILYPLWKKYNSCSLTRRHFIHFSF